MSAIFGAVDRKVKGTVQDFRFGVTLAVAAGVTQAGEQKRCIIHAGPPGAPLFSMSTLLDMVSTTVAGTAAAWS
ncbi:hypothetical protein [Salinispira pacifica]